MAGLEITEAAAEMSFMRSRSYGKRVAQVQRLAAALLVALMAVVRLTGPGDAAERPIKLVAFGDSLTAGYQLRGADAFPVQLQRALKAKGYDVEVANAGVSGDTTTGGLSRLDWSVPDGTDAVILELGANDMLRALDPKIPREALGEIVDRLKARNIEVLLAGMRAAPNLGPDYARSFDVIYPELAAANGVLLYPFFLDGVVADPKLNIGDGLHPTGEGVARIVAGIVPKVEELIGRVRAKAPSQKTP
jgi:acyl-CoA thioesterase-1